jgi:hypothetical protein
MPMHSPQNYTYNLLRTSIQRPTFQPHGAVLATSETKTLFSTQIYGSAAGQLEKCRKHITSQDSAGDYALCMWRDRQNGVDVILTPTQGILTTVVKLRIERVADGRGEGAENKSEDVKFGETKDAKVEVEKDSDLGEEVENQSGELQVRVPHPEGREFDFAGTKMWLHSLPKRWSGIEQDEGICERYPGN